MPIKNNISLVTVMVVGDGSVGKSALSVKAASNEFPDIYQFSTKVEDVFININLTSTGGERTPLNGQMRIITLPGQDEPRDARWRSHLLHIHGEKVDLVLVCFPVADVANEPDHGCVTAFGNAVFKWIPEVKGYLPKSTKFVFVATKADRRKEPMLAIIRPEWIETEMGKEPRIIAHKEFSAKDADQNKALEFLRKLAASRSRSRKSALQRLPARSAGST